MPANTLRGQASAAEAIVSGHARGDDHRQIAHEISAELSAAFQVDVLGPEAAVHQNLTPETHWIVGSSTLSGGECRDGYAICVVQVVAGISTNAVVHVSSSQSTYRASVSEGAFVGERTIRVKRRISVLEREITWPVRDDEQLAGARERLTALGYRLRPAESDVVSLLDVAEGRLAGFVGLAVDPAVRLAASLVVSEALGQVGGRSGQYPGFGDDLSLLAGSHVHHYQSIARALAGAAS